ncbi:MAG: helicase-exonuclease AddAB subunit AddA [Oscillospiraceae bacterium]|nr:helicase-exonuclease AddAB subunit AddA [Oscillospiraceae bacterium]
MGFSFTAGQQQAIETRGHSLLVSAAAGSGKTRVLTERVMSYVTDPAEPIDIDRFLIITFTRAAAGEMRSRIMDTIAAAAAANPSDRRLRHQQDKCWQAHIGTIHSFCTDILREHCHLVGLPPAFRVMEEEAADKMKLSVLEKLLESRYEKPDEDFLRLTDSVGAGRDDRRLGETVLALYDKVRSHPYPTGWTAEQKELLRTLPSLKDASETPWGQIMLESIAKEAMYHSQRMDEAVQAIYSADDKIIAAYGSVFEEDAAHLRDFVRALSEGWDRARDFLPPESFAPLGRLTRYENAALKDSVKSVRDSYKKAAELFRAALAESSEKQLGDMLFMAPAMEALLTLCEDFHKAYRAEKRREGLADFNDLEHHTLSLLIEPTTMTPTPLAKELGARYREIMVDEYQDVNAVQDMIFHALSDGGKRLFMVGDVKQSIYRFRLADPTIFLHKYDTYTPFSRDAGEGESLRILLQENFRSRKSVLDAANHVFSTIMSRELGELDYDEDAALRFAALDYPEGTDSPAELCIIDPFSAADDPDSPQQAALEARYVAQRIKAMMEAKTPVYEKGKARPCRYGDFVVLMRSPGSKGGIFHRELSLAGIPTQSKQAGDFFSSLEVGLVMDMLSVIDNPHWDVPLISVLRSPAFGFTADELAQIRAADKSTDFYSALCKAAENGNVHCSEFLEKLRSIRAAAPDLSLDELLWRIYTETELFSICSAMTGGSERRAKLMGLFEMARSFEQSGHKGLFRFSAWLRRMAERGQEPAAAQSGDNVTIMSVHKSKGLEFPFVFLCDLSHRFNKSDSSAHVLIHSRLGLGPKLTDAGRGVEFPTLARRAIAREIDRESLSEEMRVLYVALTRAREKLIMTATWKNAEAGLGKLTLAAQKPMPPTLLRGASTPLQWLSYAAILDEEELIKLEIIPADSLLESGESCADSSEEVKKEDSSAQLLKLIKDNLSHRYSHAAAVELPTKLSATELGRFEDGESLEAETMAPKFLEPDFRRPSFLEEGKKLSATAIGTATHAFMQYVDLEKVGSLALLQGELARIEDAGLLSHEEAEVIDLNKLLLFFQSDEGRLLQQGKVHREFRFTLLWDAGEVYGKDAEGEELLMQGIVDCLVEEEDSLSIIDYKTDKVFGEDIAQRAELYRSQIEAYARSVQRIFGKKVKRKLLYFLRSGVSAEL